MFNYVKRDELQDCLLFNDGGSNLLDPFVFVVLNDHIF